jgi:hypothetical protein
MKRYFFAEGPFSVWRKTCEQPRRTPPTVDLQLPRQNGMRLRFTWIFPPSDRSTLSVKNRPGRYSPLSLFSCPTFLRIQNAWAVNGDSLLLVSRPTRFQSAIRSRIPITRVTAVELALAVRTQCEIYTKQSDQPHLYFALSESHHCCVVFVLRCIRKHLLVSAIANAPYACTVLMDTIPIDSLPIVHAQ